MSTDNFPWWYPRKSHDAWAKVRRKGARRFVLVHGVLLYGGLMFLALGVISPYVRHASEMLAPESLAVNALVWAIAGLAWGALTWHFSERNFRKYATHEGTPQT